MSRRQINRWYAVAFLVLVLVGTQVTPVAAQFTAQIQLALQQLGIWPYNGSYADGQVPVWNAASSTFVAGSAGGGDVTEAGDNTFTGANIFTNGLEAYRNVDPANDEGVSLGFQAGNADASDSINIGFQAGGGTGAQTPTGSSNVRLGRSAGFAMVGDNTTIVGHAAGQYPRGSASGAVLIGYQAGRNAAQLANFHTFDAVIIGREAAINGTSNQTAVMLGAYAAKGCTDAVGATLLGYRTAETAANCRESVLIGSQAGYSLDRSRSLVIESDSTLAPPGVDGLIYGEFDNRVLQLNAGTGFRYRLESVTTTKVTTVRESGEYYYTGDTDGQAITLLNDPTPLGTYWNFVVTQTQASNSMSIAPSAGETLRDGVSTCSTFAAVAIGATARIMVTATGSGGHFTVVDKLGTWVCTP